MNINYHYFDIAIEAVDEDNKRVSGQIIRDDLPENTPDVQIYKKLKGSSIEWKRAYYFPGDDYYIFVRKEALIEDSAITAKESVVCTLTEIGLSVLNVIERESDFMTHWDRPIEEFFDKK